MAVHCAHCGEELLGAVNQCWRCGTKVLSRAGAANLPPVRCVPLLMPTEPRPAADETDIVLAGFADQVGAAGAVCPDGIRPAESRPTETTVQTCASRRRGSPFAELPSAGGSSSRWRRLVSRDRLRLNAQTATTTAAVSGLLSLAASFFTVWSLIPAVIGLGLGLCGLSSKHRGTAIVAILLCCLALLVGSFLGMVDFYESRYGFKPWDAAGGG